MQGIVEILLRLQIARNPLQIAIVLQHRAEQRLLDVDIVRDVGGKLRVPSDSTQTGPTVLAGRGW